MIATMLRPLLTFVCRVLPAVWRAWRDSREACVSPTWIAENTRRPVL